MLAKQQDKQIRVRVTVDPNSQFADIDNIKKALDEAEQRRQQWQARQPEVEAQRVAEAISKATGKWLPEDHRVHKKWLEGVIEHMDSHPRDLHPVLKEFKDLVEGDTGTYLLFCSKFKQILKKKPYSKNPSGHRQVRDYEHMLAGLVGLPINAMLDWPMGTASGFAAFLDPKVNAMLKKVLNAWGEYLCSPASAEVLGTDSQDWFGETGVKDLTATANIGETRYAFEDMFVCDSSAKHHGFSSWDAFFTRLFQEGIRPVAAPDDPDVIANACESLPLNVAHEVKARDKFWVKG
ncbi:hypothetical protein LTR04_001650 [Oleoguttula sp. CCFEE 6159]|nr:hypothetical protein LTR04_001650 [Oleoguttula sp. CCFEE 6159]